MPQHLRPAEHWADSLRLAVIDPAVIDGVVIDGVVIDGVVIDGAVISNLELEQAKDPNSWRELSLSPLGSLQLELLAGGQTDHVTQLLASHRVLLAPGSTPIKEPLWLASHAAHRTGIAR